MKIVSRFEANLLHLLRFFLRKAPEAQAVPMLVKGMDPPPCLSRATVELVQDTLAKGCILSLAGDVQKDGWKPERFLRDGRVAEGRLWERTRPEALGLPFSGHSLRFLMWVTAAALPAKPKAQPAIEHLTAGDWLLFYHAYAALRELPPGEGLNKLRVFAHNALCRLAFPGDFSEAPTDSTPDFGIWTKGVGACILEALQTELRGRLIDVEFARARPRPSAGKKITPWGQEQERVLTAFLDAVEAAGRRDLARFVLDAAGELLGTGVMVHAANAVSAFDWIDQLDLSRERLADRSETYRAILVLPRQLARLRDWDQQARTVGYFDEDYAAAQLWKELWERGRGEEHFQRAQEIIRRWESWR